MNPKKISPCLSVSDQIQCTDMAEIAALGFKAIINNRPDGESDDQPLSASLAEAADAQGIAYFDVPVVAGNLTDEDVEAFANVMSDLRGPVLAFCRTGTRSITLWALDAAKRQDADAVMRTTTAAGFDLDGLLPRLKSSATTGSALRPHSLKR